jgi:hypothetical protein
MLLPRTCRRFFVYRSSAEIMQLLPSDSQRCVHHEKRGVAPRRRQRNRPALVELSLRAW